jgi:hypothetical protein
MTDAGARAGLVGRTRVVRGAPGWRGREMARGGGAG